jgi:hypothetical protein
MAVFRNFYLSEIEIKLLKMFRYHKKYNFILLLIYKDILKQILQLS